MSLFTLIVFMYTKGGDDDVEELEIFNLTQNFFERRASRVSQ